MFSKIKSFFGFDRPSKTEPFDKILFSRQGEEHSTGVFEKKDDYCWERATLVSIDKFSYDSYNKTPFYMDASIETSNGTKEMMLTACELHYLAPYVSAESVDGLEGCVIPVMYSIDSDNCMISAENGYLVATEEEFEKRPSEI
jgi:hypothetical protein